MNAAERVDRSLIKVSAILLAGAMAALLDTTMVSVALDDLRRDFGAEIGALQLVSTVYLLAMALAVPLVGWLAGRMGARASWMLSLGLFLAGSFLSGIAWSAESLVLFRAVQGAGGGLILPLMQSILAEAAGPRRFGRAMSLVAIPGQLAPILGPVLGGAIVTSCGWRWIFLLNIPVTLVALASAWRGLPSLRRAQAPAFDLAGFLLLAPALASLIHGLSLAGARGSFLAPPAGPWLAAGSLLLAGFASATRRKGERSLIDLGLLGRRPYAAATCLAFLIGVSIYGPMFLLPLYLQWGRGDGALSAGAMLAPQGIGTMLAVPFAGRWSDRSGPRPAVLAGMSVTAVATFALAGLDSAPGLDAAESRTPLALVLFARGAGLGLAGIPAMAAAYHGLGAHEFARATAGINVVQRLGASFGTALSAVVLQHFLSSAPTGDTSVDGTHVAAAFGAAFSMVAVFALVALIPALLLPRRAPPAQGKEPACAGVVPAGVQTAHRGAAALDAESAKTTGGGGAPCDATPSCEP